ncbi:hypothetical protein K492DRAFT_181207 [Lichtheimia hyalospora FSU 10163]|nr:hypothetical protein K492DRAFT_181207 [Lichtheimia hyalospora FSU 10163]
MCERTPLFISPSTLMDSHSRASNGTPVIRQNAVNGSSSSLSRHEFERQVAELMEIQVNYQQQTFLDMKTIQSTIEQLKTVVDTLDMKTRYLQELVSNVTPKLQILQDTLSQLVSEQQHLIPEVVLSVCNKTGTNISDNDNSAKQVQTVIETFLKRVTDQMQATVDKHHQALFKMLDTDKLNLHNAPPSPPKPPKPSWPSRMIVCPELSDDDDDVETNQQQSQCKFNVEKSCRQVSLFHCALHV